MFRFLALNHRLLLATIALLAFSACSQQPAPEISTSPNVSSPPASAPSAAEQAPSSAPKSAVKVYIDPATGEIREPTAAELTAAAAEQKQNSSKAQAPQVAREIVHTDGTVEIIMHRSTNKPLVGCLDKNDGIKIDHQCQSTAPARDGQ
ncbi:MAG TPA: hypothetical protein VK629_14540 [Steroidobacteraceae bacterium]|nr:hypothetical protein [Steroidobacteraceae bacterium]